MHERSGNAGGCGLALQVYTWATAPESYEAIEGMVKKYKTIGDARKTLLASEEFQASQRPPVRPVGPKG